MNDGFNEELREWFSRLDEFLAKWRQLHEKYQKTPSAEDRAKINKKIKDLEKTMYNT